MKIVDITRKFKYNSIDLGDPNPALGPDQVREFYASQYPELNNAVVEGPVTKNAVATFTFARAAGAKGAGAALAVPAAEVIRRTLAGRDSSSPDGLLQCVMEHRHAQPAHRMAAVAASNNNAPRLPIPARAFGHWG
jgi:PRTRC genetic system protein C